MPGEAMMVAGGYTEAGYAGYHGGYEEARHGPGAWPGGVAGAGYHHHHHAGLAHSQGSPTQRYPYYDSRYTV